MIIKRSYLFFLLIFCFISLLKARAESLTLSHQERQSRYFFNIDWSAVDENVARLTSVQLYDLDGNYLVNKKPGWSSQYSAKLGFYFSNHSFLSSLMGQRNSLSLAFSYRSAKQKFHSAYLDDGGLHNGRFFQINGVEVNPATPLFPGLVGLVHYQLSNIFINRELDLTWSGQQQGNNCRWFFIPQFSLVYDWQTNNQNNNAQYRAVYPAPDSLTNDVLTIKQHIDYAGVGFAESIGLNLNAYFSLLSSITIQALHANAHFNANEDYLLNAPDLHESGALSASLTDREILSLSMRINLLGQSDRPYITVGGGVTHWGWIPQFAKLKNDDVGLHYAGAVSAWNPYVGISLIVPV